MVLFLETWPLGVQCRLLHRSKHQNITAPGLTYCDSLTQYAGVPGVADRDPGELPSQIRKLLSGHFDFSELVIVLIPLPFSLVRQLNVQLRAHCALCGCCTNVSGLRALPAVFAIFTSDVIYGQRNLRKCLLSFPNTTLVLSTADA